MNVSARRRLLGLTSFELGELDSYEAASGTERGLSEAQKAPSPHDGSRTRSVGMTVFATTNRASDSGV